jgi:hypothetical protein
VTTPFYENGEPEQGRSPNTFEVNERRNEKEIKANKIMLAEMIAKMDANHEKRMARMDAWLTDLKTDQKETPACQGTIEARLETEEPASVETTPEVANDREVPKADAEVRSVAEPRKRRRDQRRDLATMRRQKNKTKFWTRDVAGGNRSWSLPADGRPVVRWLRDAECY